MKSDSTTTKHYADFARSIQELRLRSEQDDPLIRRLLYANVVTSLEVYLQAVALHLIDQAPSLAISVANAKKFKNVRMSLEFALRSNLHHYLVTLIRHINFYNLSDVEPLFREAFDIRIEITDAVLDVIRCRHDIVHRNGEDKQGRLHEISPAAMEGALEAMDRLVSDVDRQLLERFGALFTPC
ncbi:hypothetical protein FGL86_11215 [Pistricoccus aurantiacus]|uniref:RiboL-PSP-HEPN domain-containing protein n=1 Tax=Pistricoccus aurantiacus TaxID=1883414 RepID=A0A5B8SXQ2_9GAMM|nr:hypothetical protein [Pistricoccus aurantiacus]QEA39590.1 hypothetical protein FGL86_11215 [Pistricoccus aurantiacus]